MHNKKAVTILWIILFAGFILRMASFILNLTNFKLYGDALSYSQMAHQCLEKGIYGYANRAASGSSNAFVTPGYPLFLTGIYALVKDPYLQITAARFAQALIGSLTPFLGYLFVRRAFNRIDIALLTSFFIAVYPPYIESPSTLFTEVPALATMLLYFYLAAKGFQEGKPGINIMAGMSFALHILIRPAMLPLYILPFIFAYFSEYRKQPVKLLLIFIQSTAGFILLMAPWWIRNFIVFNEIILTATQTGNPLLGGTYPYNIGLYADASKEVMSNPDLQVQFAKQRIMKGFMTQPLYYLQWYTLGKLSFLFGQPWLYKDHLLFKEPWSYRHLPFIDSISLAFHSLFIYLGTLGAVINSIKDKVSRYVNIYGLMFTAIYLAFIAINRYAYQLMFFLMLSAAVLICNLSVFVYKKVRSHN